MARHRTSVPRRASRLATLLALLAATRAGAATLEATVADAQGRPVADAVVVAVPRTPVPAPPRPAAAVEVSQKSQEFVPFVTAIPVGTAVQFPNQDTVRHHVYSFSAPKQFEIKLYAGVPEKPVLFDKPGVVTLGCNIHDWMLAYIYVADTPFVAVTDASGKASLADLPGGRYALRVWHPGLVGNETDTQREIEMPAGKTSVDASWTVQVKLERRVRRAPSLGGGGYK